MADADLDNQPSRQALIGGAVIWLYNLATGNSLSEFIGMIVTHGYTQGPGQAYAFGTLWEKGGIADCATVGVIYAALGFLSAAIVGVPVARWFVRKGLNANKTGASITKEFLTGIMDEKSTATNGRETTHASTIDTLAFHVALVGIVYLITYAELSWIEAHIKPFFDQYKWLKGFGATLSMPMFFIHGLIVAWLLRTLLLKLGAGRLMDPVVQTRITGASVDYLADRHLDVHPYRRPQAVRHPHLPRGVQRHPVRPRPQPLVRTPDQLRA